MRHRLVVRSFFDPLLSAVVLCILLLAGPASAVTIDWVLVGDPLNAPDTPTNCNSVNCGSVPYVYSISKYEVTNAQYAEFLNAKAASDPLELYNPSMGSDASNGGITRSGVPGSYTYTVKADFEDKPVVYVSFFDALRFANWLNNSQGSGDTETGAYTLLGGTPTPSNGTTVTRIGGAISFLPSENEWYKAAYYDATSASFFDYPTATNTQPTCSAPTATPNHANCSAVGLPQNDLTSVGSYPGSASSYGTFDQAGNVYEWNEEIVSPSERGLRGGSWANGPEDSEASFLDSDDPMGENEIWGFRVAMVPEVGTGLLVVTGLLALAVWQKRHP